MDDKQPTVNDLRDLWEKLNQHASPANVVYLHPEAAANIQLIEERRKHWYWRVWWRIRWAPADLMDWLRGRTQHEED